MSKACAFVRRLLRDETGGEVLEYALIAGLIIVLFPSLLSGPRTSSAIFIA